MPKIIKKLTFDLLDELSTYDYFKNEIQKKEKEIPD